MKHPKIFLTLILVVFAAIVAVFVLLPRSSYSELERRELAEFPSFTLDSLLDGSWAQAVSTWFSDTEPYRDHIMAASMQIKGNMGINTMIALDDDALTFHAPDAVDGAAPGAESIGAADAARLTGGGVDSIAGYTNRINADEENTKIGHSGILVVGTPPNARAMMAFGASGSAGTEFARTVSSYRQAFDGKINVYCMVIPNSIEFYCPDKAKKITKPQHLTINNIYQHLTDGAKGVDCYTPLSQHAAEDIYLRTDHHWAPRGAYYAAQAFARVAGVPFADLSTYDEHVIHGFVGTMYGYSKDIAVRQSAEDFVYYTPTGVDYSTTYIIYNVDKSLHITGESRPQPGPFFYKFKDGSGMAYSTFMGSDQKITQVRTSTDNGRRLVIFKDSFGNALPGYLFHSFEEIHVIDYRYFTHNFVKYAQEHGITDILFAHSVFMCLGSKAQTSYARFLTQSGGIAPRPKAAESDGHGATRTDSARSGRGRLASPTTDPELTPAAASATTADPERALIPAEPAAAEPASAPKTPAADPVAAPAAPAAEPAGAPSAEPETKSEPSADGSQG